MSLFDQMAGMSGNLGENMGAYQEIFSWCQQEGGISGLLEKFRQSGLSGIVDSWVSSGNNLPISSEQIASILGSPVIAGLATKLGIDAQSASGLIAEYLPKIVDGLSPNGHLDENNDLVSTGLSMLKGKLFG
ncbi:YidB family protein [Buttiauxella sp. A111]|uniref:YidB family protein n=1 Tax=Buttiauxella sp. A111 TaxID=2563088 RepID=UPI0010CF3113|nr:YidB family protein [Buttiauxella sp. A111]GDX04448.1 DUF937 domain-containing protein [Buttiauxella sp. A111]